ncbi:MAG TPA: DUF4136 domain-containing protein [Puia sp.]|nr:DUF4136 domain-containing protein [Puia sp.]
MKSVQRTILIGAVLGILVLSGCRKDPLNHLTNDESRIYVTNYDTTVNFSSFTTFSIADSVAVVQDNQLAGRSITGFDSSVIGLVAGAMTQAGYKQVAKTASPDLAIDITRVYNTSTAIFDYSNYWDYYGDYWDPYYWGYPDYGYYDPYAVGTYSITTGALEIDLLDLRDAPADSNKIRVIWTGMARGEQVFNPANVNTEVSALFAQSGYLKK